MKLTKNKKLFLLVILVLLPVVTQCMKRDFSKISSSPSKTATILETKRDEVILYNYTNPSPHAELALYQNNHQLALLGCKDMIYLNQYKNVFVNGYSFLGLAAMSIHFKMPIIMRPPFAGPENNFSIRDAFYHEKDPFIQKLLELKFKPTPDDKKIACIEKWERCLPIIIESTYRFCYIDNKAGISVPSEIKNYIATLLFWLKFNAEKSLY